MRYIVIQYNYLGVIIEQTVDLVDIINQQPFTYKVETILELIELLDEPELLEEHQKVLIKNKLKQINDLLKWD